MGYRRLNARLSGLGELTPLSSAPRLDLDLKTLVLVLGRPPSLPRPPALASLAAPGLTRQPCAAMISVLFQQGKCVPA